ncbi:MAG: hypothetical protein AB7H86_17995 [Blastocatellales bacterium]
MITISQQQNRVLTVTDGRSRRGVSGRKVFWASIGSFIGLAGGFILPVTGFALLAVNRLLSAPNPTIQKIGTILVVATVPLIVIGGFCLDLLEKPKSRDTRE